MDKVTFTQDNMQLGALIKLPDSVVNWTDFGRIVEKSKLGVHLEFKTKGKTPQRHFVMYDWLNKHYGSDAEKDIDGIVHPQYMTHQGEYSKYANKVLHMGRTPLTFTEWVKSRDILNDDISDVGKSDPSDAGRDEFGRDKPCVLALPGPTSRPGGADLEDPLDTETKLDKLAKGETL